MLLLTHIFRNSSGCSAVDFEVAKREVICQKQNKTKTRYQLNLHAHAHAPCSHVCRHGKKVERKHRRFQIGYKWFVFSGVCSNSNGNKQSERISPAARGMALGAHWSAKQKPTHNCHHRQDLKERMVEGRRKKKSHYCSSLRAVCRLKIELRRSTENRVLRTRIGVRLAKLLPLSRHQQWSTHVKSLSLIEFWVRFLMFVS